MASIRRVTRKLPTILMVAISTETAARSATSQLPADSELKPASIPINYRPPFRFEAGHDSDQLSAGFRL